MRIIDEKGRLFGKINIIDFLVILILCGAIPLFYIGYRIINKPAVIMEVPKDMREVEINVKFIKLPLEVLARLAVGDKEIDSRGQILGQVIWLGVSSPYRYNFDLGQGKTVVVEDPQLKEISAKFKFMGEIRDNSVCYKGQRVNIGSPIEFKTEKYSVQVVPIVDQESTREEEKKPVWLELDVTLTGLDGDTVKLISVGDKELSKDGTLIAEIIKTGKVERQNYDLYFGDGYFTTAQDTSHKQITVKMRIKSQTSDEKTFFFKNVKLVKDLPVTFVTDKYKVEGRLARSFEVPVVPLKEKWMKAKIRFNDLMPELVRVIKEGDMEKNSSGKIVGKLISVLDIRASDVLIVHDNKMVNIANPFTKDLEVFFSLLCVEQEGVLCYKNYPVKMGNLIIFSTELYSISGVIIGIQG